MEKPTESAVPCCGNCLYYRSTAQKDGALIFVCKIDAPKVTAALGPGPNGPQWYYDMSRPPMDKGEWCGKWKGNQ